jgi:hypothetical protein
MAFDLVAVIDGEIDGFEAVIGQVEIVGRVVPPQRRQLLVVAAGPGRFGWDEARRALRSAARISVGRQVGRLAGHVLEMRLADHGRAIAGLAQPLDEGRRLQRQRNAVVPHAVQ